MNRREAIQIDTDFYTGFDVDSGMWCVFGCETGFAYAACAYEEEAEEALKNYEKRI